MASELINELLSDATVIGIAIGIANLPLFQEALKCTLKKVLRCTCPEQKGKRCKKFVRTLNYFLKVVKLRTGWSCRKARSVFRPGASAMDKLFDRIIEIKDPFYSYAFDTEQSRSVNDVLNVCNVHRPLPYFLVLAPWKVKHVKKIAEGSYGEIYMSKNFDEEEKLLKVIAVYGTNRDEPQKSLALEDAVGDAICSKYLSELHSSGPFHAPNFPKVYSINLVKGNTPKAVVEAWKEFKDNPKTEETTHCSPDRYSNESMFLVMELEHCGKQYLDQHSLNSLQALSLILQTASALAVAESAYGFEHRDLHMGNWLAKKTEKTQISYSTTSWRWSVPTFNIQAYIIDFTMSRIEIDGRVFAMDMTYMGTVQSDGDDVEPDSSRLHYNNIYNMMKEELQHNYGAFLPKTNIAWLAHLCSIVYQRVKAEVGSLSDNGSRSDRIALYALERLKDNMMSYSTTMDFLQGEVFAFQDMEPNP